MSTTTNETNVKETKKVAYWEYVNTDADGNIMIKILNKDLQTQLNEMMQKAEAKIDAEEKRNVAKQNIDDFDEFDDLVSELINTEAVYIKAGKMTGKNLNVDWDKVNSMRDKGMKTIKSSSGVVEKKHEIQATTIVVEHPVL